MKKDTTTPKSMNKKSLIASSSEISELSRNESRQALNAVMVSITKSLKDGNDVKVPGFGVFKVVHRSAMEGRNPRTREPLKIPAKKMPKFRSSPMLKREIS